MVDAVKGKFRQAPRGNKLVVLLGVSAGLLIAGLPFMNKKVRDVEDKMAELRDNQYDAMDFKNDARNARLSNKRQPSLS